MHIVWFKRDLRIEDHKALTDAANNGHVLPLYIVEPELWYQPDLSYRHYMFLQDCISELDKELQNLGQRLIIKVGNILDVFEDLRKGHNIQALWSHQETWNGWTYERDKRVKYWCKSHNIPWYEPVQNGVIRGLKDRNGWSRLWYYYMKKPIVNKPIKLKSVTEPTDTLPCYKHLRICKDGLVDLQQGGRLAGLQLLHNFLYKNGESYAKEMSSPVTAFNSCSRLSTHLAFGTLSLREVFQACDKRNQEIKQMFGSQKGKWSSAMRSFSARLRWHCHFIQKLEDEPCIEFKNMHPAYDSLRKQDFNFAYFEAWKSGMTGYPMVDACMRALKSSGWINFRMRAMLMSFASYHLWLDWRKPALYLANLFTDYEPGIHYSQVQMQSGTTGINTIRIYNPIKQGIDHDPEGIFIRHWIPELQNMETELIHMPWQDVSKMNGYPMPIIDEKMARKRASLHIYGLRRNNHYKEVSQKIFNKHGSRKSVFPKKDNKKIRNIIQGELII